MKSEFHQFCNIFYLIKRFHFDVENNTIFSVLLHYSCKKKRWSCCQRTLYTAK